MSGRRIVGQGKCPGEELPGRGNVREENCPAGEMSSILFRCLTPVFTLTYYIFPVISDFSSLDVKIYLFLLIL